MAYEGEKSGFHPFLKSWWSYIVVLLVKQPVKNMLGVTVFSNFEASLVNVDCWLFDLE